MKSTGNGNRHPQQEQQSHELQNPHENVINYFFTLT